MAITLIQITKDNIVGDCDILAIHSPLIFLAEATYDVAPPDNLYVRIYDGNDVLLGNYKGVPSKEISPTVRQFRFRADAILRQWLPPIEDFEQTAGTLVFMDSMAKKFKLLFSNLENKAKGQCTKTITFQEFAATGPYPISASVIVDGIARSVSTTEYPPSVFNGKNCAALLISLYNASFPGLVGTKIQILDILGGYSITNFTSSNIDTIDFPLFGGSFTSYSQQDVEISRQVVFRAITAAAQFGETEARQLIFNNQPQGIIGTKGKWAYAYFYNEYAGGTTISASETNSALYEMVATNEGTLTGITATQVSPSVIKFSKDAPGTGNVAFSANGNFYSIEIKITEVVGTFSGSTNKLEMTYVNNGMAVVDLDSLGVGTHIIPLNPAFTTSGLKVYIVGDIAETKSVSIDYIRLIGQEVTCS